MADIFLSYRREDEQNSHIVGRIYDNLCRMFGEQALFVDIENAELSHDFVEGILREIGDCKVFLIIIGTHWLDCLDRRRASAQDFVRLEVETALARQAPILPVMVDAGTMPAPDRLPATMRGLTRIHGMQVRGAADFRRDIEEVAGFIVDQAVPRIDNRPVDPRVEHVAKVISPVIGDPMLLRPENYGVSIRRFLPDALLLKTGIGKKSDDVVEIDEAGWMLLEFELCAAIETAFDVQVGVTLDSTAVSLAREIFDDPSIV